jgi:signal transduction histidine kinase
MPLQQALASPQMRPEGLAGAGRRFVIVLVATVLGLSTVLAAYFYVQQQEYSRFSFQNLVWEGVQLRNEHQAFRAALVEALGDLPGASMQEVVQRYDILYGRLDLLETGHANLTYQSDPRIRELLLHVNTVIRGWDKLVAAYAAGDREAGLRIAEEARAMDPTLSAFTAAINLIGAKRVDDARERMARLYAALIAAVVVICLLVFGFAFALLRQLKMTEKAHLDLRNMTVDLEQARREAEEASRAKSTFLATMSHELRTPLNAILGFADIMRQGLFGPVGSQRYLDYLDGIVKSGQHLLSLINDVLDMSRIEAGRIELRETNLDIGLAIDQALSLVAVTAEGKGVTLQHSVPPGLPQLRADERLLRQILLNLLSNAIKFTPEGGHVEVAAATLTDGGVAIRVRDTGIGMSDAQLRRIFEPFSHGDSLRARETGGSGLGLPITRRLVELHGGQIHISSRKSLGTTATLVFPVARAVTVGAVQ